MGLIFQPTSLEGAWLVMPEPSADARGFYARTVGREEFAARGLKSDFAQCGISYNIAAGTLRGMHYQTSPHQEAKLVRCTTGAICDVIVDLRPDSPTYRRWESFDLSAENRAAIYIPEGMAHGFITLRERCEVYYQITVPYCAAAARGVRWNDPAFGIAWPTQPRVICDRDAQYADYQP